MKLQRVERFRWSNPGSDKEPVKLQPSQEGLEGLLWSPQRARKQCQKTHHPSWAGFRKKPVHITNREEKYPRIRKILWCLFYFIMKSITQGPILYCKRAKHFPSGYHKPVLKSGHLPIPARNLFVQISLRSSTVSAFMLAGFEVIPGGTIYTMEIGQHWVPVCWMAVACHWILSYKI